MRSSKQYVYKCFELRLQTTDVFEAEKWRISGFRVRVYDGEEYLGDLMDNSDVFARFQKSLLSFKL